LRVLSPSLLRGRELDHIVNGMRAFMSNNAVYNGSVSVSDQHSKEGYFSALIP